MCVMKNVSVSYWSTFAQFSRIVYQKQSLDENKGRAQEKQINTLKLTETYRAALCLSVSFFLLNTKSNAVKWVFYFSRSWLSTEFCCGAYLSLFTIVYVGESCHTCVAFFI